MKQIKINFQKGNGLVPAIVQDYQSGDVLMLGYINKKAFQKILKERFVYFWSRSRKKLWSKGEESGNRLKVKKIFVDCDADAVLIQAKLVGKNACHSGNKSCFYQEIAPEVKKAK